MINNWIIDEELNRVKHRIEELEDIIKMADKAPTVYNGHQAMKAEAELETIYIQLRRIS